MKTILYVVWAVFVVAAIFALVPAVRKTRRREQLTAAWPRVQATVTGSVAGWTNGGGGSSRSRRFFPTYQFADPQGTPFAGESEISFARKPVPGSLVEVAYNPSNPHESLQVSSAPKTAMGCLIPFCAVLQPRCSDLSASSRWADFPLVIFPLAWRRQHNDVCITWASTAGTRRLRP